MDFTKLQDDMYGEWEKSMTAWWDQVLDNPAFLGKLGENVAGMAKARKMYEDTLDKGLERAHLPTRSDLVRVARIVSLVEDKVLGVEDRVLAMGDRLDNIEKEALTARVETAEARVALTERLDRIEAKLDALLGARPTPTPASDDAPKAAPRRGKGA